MEPLDRNNIEELLPRYCEGLVTEEECLSVEAWLEESEANRKIAKQVYNLCWAADTVHLTKKVNTEKALMKVKARMTDNRKTLWWEWAQRVAAILFIPLLTALIMQYWGGNSPQIVNTMKVQTNPGMTTSLQLPDGTLVFLNSESTLTYPSEFKEDIREVTLQGEAYFEVARHPEKKFVVSTAHHSQIEVLGTHFNVEAYSKDDKVTTTLIEGKINFVFKEREVLKKIPMAPGHKLVYDSQKDHVRLSITSGESETAWKEGKIIFKNTPLEEGLRMLEKRYNVEFIIKNDRLKNDSFTGTFTNQHLERILKYFQLSSRIRWRYLESSEITDEKSKIEIY